MAALKSTLRQLLLFLGFLLIWQEIISLFHLPSYILPTPWQVLHALTQHSGLILRETIPTIIETILGLLLGIIFGGCTGFLLAFSHRFSHWLLPVLIISQVIPTFAIAPILVIWFGYGLASKIAITVLMLFFPVTSSFYDGLRRTNPGWLDLAKIMNASKWRTFWHIRVPAALPAVATGIRLCAVIAPIGAIVGEWVGSSAGLGYLMLNANARMQIDMMFAVLIVIVVLALCLYFSVDALLRRIIYWERV
ncbi:MAG: ABC transporter permease [Gammaproteobacteria bacterium RIFCSPHIGHO2_12_FULL_42_13]|nr:MAG: ABC transporter permease [Gammaproteobacteria bacterium RIFCSPHIGHO2_12_FULL_42_13]